MAFCAKSIFDVLKTNWKVIKVNCNSDGQTSLKRHKGHEGVKSLMCQKNEGKDKCKHLHFILGLYMLLGLCLHVYNVCVCV